jgi:hypothetical protein
MELRHKKKSMAESFESFVGSVYLARLRDIFVIHDTRMCVNCMPRGLQHIQRHRQIKNYGSFFIHMIGKS